MTKRGYFEIPADRLPPGFASRIERPPEKPAEPAPSATVVLLRDGEHGMEALLLRRHRRSGFVPGAYVFPGGRVDEGDADPALHAACVRPPAAEPPAEYRFAALREAFEETGIPVGLVRTGSGSAASASTAAHESLGRRLDGLRQALLEDRVTLAGVVRALELRIDPDALTYFAHWITPVAESRRYDTRFFLAVVAPDQAVAPDAREMTDAVWIRPAAALDRFRAGRLPMVFPTVTSLEALASYETADAAIGALRGRPVRTILPRLVRTETGVAIVVDPPSSEKES